MTTRVPSLSISSTCGGLSGLPALGGDVSSISTTTGSPCASTPTSPRSSAGRPLKYVVTTPVARSILKTRLAKPDGVLVAVGVKGGGATAQAAPAPRNWKPGRACDGSRPDVGP